MTFRLCIYVAIVSSQFDERADTFCLGIVQYARMCGGYGFFAPSNFRQRFHIAQMDFALKPRYNARPGQFMPVITRNSPNKAELMKWGLVPHWAKEPRVKFSTFNARAETVVTSPAYRTPFRQQRCLVPANGFFEWKGTDHGKQPYFIKLKSRPLFAFAGLFDVWKDAEGKELKTYTIITTTPNSVVAPIHDRMPVILYEADESTWLNPNIQAVPRLGALLKPYNETNMTAYRIRTLVNDPVNDRPDVIEPIG
jgi:putative SOS response-associated peptidase YedK